MAILRYTALRVVLVIAAWLLLFALGMRGWLGLGAAIIAGWPLSYVLLTGPRRAAAAQLAANAQARAKRRSDVGADELSEDAAIDREQLTQDTLVDHQPYTEREQSSAD